MKTHPYQVAILNTPEQCLLFIIDIDNSSVFIIDSLKTSWPHGLNGRPIVLKVSCYLQVLLCWLILDLVVKVPHISMMMVRYVILYHGGTK